MPRDVGAVTPDVPAPCALGGTGRLRVTVSIDPTLDRARADIWLAARCGDGDQDRPVRVLRWNRESMQTFEGLGPGSYQVFASSFLSQGSWSSRVTLGGGTTAAVPVTLQGGPTPLATLRTGGDAPNAPGFDLGGVHLANLDIIAPGGGTRVGRLDVTAAAAADGVLVQCLVRSVCAAPPCTRIEVTGLEVRMQSDATPGDLGARRFDTIGVGPGDITALPPVLVRGRMPDATHTLEVALYGALAAAARATP